MQIIPLASVPSQDLTVQLDSQNCQIAVYTLNTGLYLDLSIDNAPVIIGALCHDRCLLVRQAYLGFVGDLSFIDTQGTDDPVYTGLGDRWSLLYLEPADL